jgi:hypothetical protein
LTSKVVLIASDKELANSPSFWQIFGKSVFSSEHLKGKSENHRVFIDDLWWAWVDLNHRPRPYQGRALAT